MNFITSLLRKINKKKEMEKVRYYLPGITVRCISEYCRKDTLAKIIDHGYEDNKEVILIEYSDGDQDTARVGRQGEYDLEFVDSQDELLQIAMEKYKDGYFKSLSGTSFANHQPVRARWYDHTKRNILIDDADGNNAHVYDNGKWAEIQGVPRFDIPKYKTGDKIDLLPLKDRNNHAFINVKPIQDGYEYHGGYEADEYGQGVTIEDVCFSEDKREFYYKIASDAWYSESAIKATDSIPMPKDAEFPEEGQCKTIAPNLERYLRSTRTPEGDQSQKDKAKAICWNHKGYWYVSRSSQKQEYPIGYLSQFFTQKTEEMPPERSSAEPQQFDYTPQGGFQLTLPPEIVGAALSQATQTHFRESEKKFEKHRNDVLALVDQKKQMIETELYQKFEKTIGCDFVEFKTKVVEDYLTSKQVVIELGQDKKYEFSLDDKHEQLPKMVTFLQLFKQAMIVGPSGSGKSTMAKQAAEVMGLRYGAFSCNLEASKSELVGFANIDGYVESSFLDFYENGGVFLVDKL